LVHVYSHGFAEVGIRPPARASKRRRRTGHRRKMAPVTSLCRQHRPAHSRTGRSYADAWLFVSAAWTKPSGGWTATDAYRIRGLHCRSH